MKRDPDATALRWWMGEVKADGALSLRAPGRILEIWNPQTGDIKRVSNAKFARGQTELPLSLAPYATMLLVVR